MNDFMAEKILRKPKFADESKIETLLKEQIEKNKSKIVVLDDDPTGVQTVHDVSVYTNWDLQSIQLGFQEETKLFFILTNSRGMSIEETIKIHQEIGQNISFVAKKLGMSYMIVSRSDSTLRGHYPLETQILKKSIEKNGQLIDGEIICPFFKEGGRVTIDNIHYVCQDENLVPVGETEFAQDKTFGYKNSSIPLYIEEKTNGEYRAEGVINISLTSLRNADIGYITEQLMSVKDFNKICVNAVDYYDLKVFCVSLYQAMGQGKKFLFRTAASFVKVLGGVSDAPLLSRNKLIVDVENKNGGIIIVGSHTEKTTKQLNELLKLHQMIPVEFDSDKVLENRESFEAEILRCIKLEEEIVKSGKTAVCYTKRQVLALPDDTPEKALQRSKKISEGVQKLIGELTVIPAFIIAKGGITSSDIGVKALKVKHAVVVGQILPGVPVWETGDESKFPNIPYVIFPGNTGGKDALKMAVQILLGNSFP